MTGLELLKAPETTASEIADIISAPCPPTIPAHCDGVSCRECWLTWLTGEPIKEKEPPDKQGGSRRGRAASQPCRVSQTAQALTRSA